MAEQGKALVVSLRRRVREMRASDRGALRPRVERMVAALAPSWDEESASDVVFNACMLVLAIDEWEREGFPSRGAS